VWEKSRVSKLPDSDTPPVQPQPKGVEETQASGCDGEHTIHVIGE
jgi:hypothetical protein